MVINPIEVREIIFRLASLRGTVPPFTDDNPTNLYLRENIVNTKAYVNQKLIALGVMFCRSR